jgi:hypothetical protein
MADLQRYQPCCCYTASDTGELYDVEDVDAEIARLKAQLPEGMQECTIRFIECPVGHGRLTAANWVDHGCDTCERNRLKAQLSVLRKQIAAEKAEHVQTEAMLTETWAKHCEEHVQAATAPLETVRMLIETFDDTPGAPSRDVLLALIDQIRAAVEIPSFEATEADQVK